MNSPIRWFGGKGHLTKHLLEFEPPHELYVEPFGGGASLLFAKEPSKSEVYNDLDGLVVTFFTVLQRAPEELRNRLALMPYSREVHKAAKPVLDFTKFDTFDSIDKAIALYVLSRQSMSGDLKGGWSYGLQSNPALQWCASIERLEDCIKRFMTVQVENLDMLECIKKYDGKDTWFYIDPPYHCWTRKGGGYRLELKVGDHTKLLRLLNTVQGMVLLSGYNPKGQFSETDHYITMLTDWEKYEVETVSHATGTTRKTGITGEGALKENHKRTEVLWYNQNLKDALDKKAEKEAANIDLFDFGGK